jgi:hypothetical protein
VEKIRGSRSRPHNASGGLRMSQGCLRGVSECVQGWPRVTPWSARGKSGILASSCLDEGGGACVSPWRLPPPASYTFKKYLEGLFLLKKEICVRKKFQRVFPRGFVQNKSPTYVYS